MLTPRYRRSSSHKSQKAAALSPPPRPTAYKREEVHRYHSSTSKQPVAAHGARAGGEAGESASYMWPWGQFDWLWAQPAHFFSCSHRPYAVTHWVRRSGERRSSRKRRHGKKACSILRRILNFISKVSKNKKEEKERKMKPRECNETEGHSLHEKEKLRP